MGKKNKTDHHCPHCKFFKPGTQDQGTCQIHPPTSAGANHHACWPVVQAGDWCGKFKASKVSRT